MMEKRKKKARAPKPVMPSQEAERYYSGQLRGMVRLMAEELVKALEPELKRLKRDYIADAKPTMDGWTDDILAAIRGVSRRFSSSLFEFQIQRVAASTISRADADNAEDFRKSVNQAVGVDFQLITRPKGMQDYLEASTAENVNLIKSIPDEYFKNVETIVLGGMKDGLAPTAIAKQIQEQTGVSARRAKLIARDQVSQLNSDLTRQRQASAGIEFYKAVDAGDQRVSGAPGGKYPNAKISCYGIARQDIGYGPGVYKVADGAPWGGKTGLHPGKHHPLCFPGDVSPNFFSGIRRLYRRPYSGRFIEVLTSLGDRVVTTPNHPFLCKEGWRAAKDLEVGDHLLGIDKNASLIREMHGNEAVSSFADLFSTLSKGFGLVSAGGMGSQFHGDGAVDQEVDIVDIDGVLRDELESMGIEQASHFDFTSALAAAVEPLFVGSHLEKCFPRALGAPPGIMRCADALHSLCFGHLGHADEVCIATASNLYAVLLEYSGDDVSSNAKIAGYSKNAITLDVSVAKSFLVKVYRVVCGSLMGHQWNSGLGHSESYGLVGHSKFFGDLAEVESRIIEIRDLPNDFLGIDLPHVYNLETSVGWYNIDSIAVKNCRCVAIAMIPGVNYFPGKG